MSNAARKDLHALIDALPAGEEQAASRVRVEDAAETIWIVAAWSAPRGSGPELP